jgi:hypothetical protein
VTAVDAAQHILAVPERNISAAGLEQHVRIQHADARHLPFAAFVAVISDSILHERTLPVPRSSAEPLDKWEHPIRIEENEPISFVCGEAG